MKDNFTERAKQHMGWYRREVLNVQAAGTFTFKGTPYIREHILPSAERNKNILETIRDDFWRYASAAEKGAQPLTDSLHEYFYHLTSSQAMCFNLFYPLIQQERIALLIDCLRIPVTGPVQATFELESKIESAARKTNFDFHVGWPTNNGIFFEVKYTEAGFAKVGKKELAQKDSKHRNKFKATYEHLVNDAAEFLSNTGRNEDFFLSHYQIMRNLAHLSTHTHVVFVFPSGNKKVKEEAAAAMRDALTDAGRKRVRVLHVEDLVAEFEKHNFLNDHWQQFRAKYLPAPGI